MFAHYVLSWMIELALIPIFCVSGFFFSRFIKSMSTYSYIILVIVFGEVTGDIAHYIRTGTNDFVGEMPHLTALATIAIIVLIRISKTKKDPQL
jgi:hypothetical protein